MSRDQTDPPVRITAKPGTAEYERQFARQALGAADRALRMWTVRLPCGVFALIGVWLMVDIVSTSSESWLHGVGHVICFGLMTLETGAVCLTGKSLYLRYALSGARRSVKSAGNRNGTA